MDNETTIKILVNDIPIGAIQSVALEEQPSNTPGQKIKATRIRFDRKRIEEAFNNGFLHAASQFLPLQIIIEEPTKTIKINNAWLISKPEGYTTEEMKNLDCLTAYTINDWLITDELFLEAESIFISGTIR